MKYYVNGENININTNKPFNKGSEGQVYKIDDKIYKVYYKNALNEGFGNKLMYHQYLLGINTEQIILPESLIFNKDYEYVGYTTKFINGEQDVNKKRGITQMKSSTFVKNLQVLEDNINLLSKYNVILVDITPFNYIFDKDNELMYIIDPGRYRNNIFGYDNSDFDRYKNINMKQYETLIELLYLDFTTYKPLNSKRKLQLLRDYIKHEKDNLQYSEFFNQVLKEYENVNEYAKSLGKYIK